jgi:hypothetical protein
MTLRYDCTSSRRDSRGRLRFPVECENSADRLGGLAEIELEHAAEPLTAYWARSAEWSQSERRTSSYPWRIRGEVKPLRARLIPAARGHASVSAIPRGRNAYARLSGNRCQLFTKGR